MKAILLNYGKRFHLLLLNFITFFEIYFKTFCKKKGDIFMQERINNAQNKLTTTDFNVLNYLMTNKQKIQNQSIHEITEKTFTSSASIVRLAKKLGFSGFSEMKYYIKSELEDNSEQFKSSISLLEQETIKVAEAAKVIENAQRDINIAFMNELSIIFNMMDIDTRAVLDAAETKWNFKKFSPGLVGGHCIGVDPYYLTHKAEQLGYHPDVVLAGRRINDGMGKYVAENTVKELIDADINIKHAKVAILGFTFKENVPDIRNTRTIDIINELADYGITPLIHDPQADYEEAYEEYGIHFNTYDEIKDLDAIVLTVEHHEYKKLTKNDFDKLYSNNSIKKVMIDVKGVLNRKEMLADNYNYWRL